MFEDLIVDLDLNRYPTEVWHCDDPRLPLDKDITRIMPDDNFIKTVQRVGVMSPILVAYQRTGANMVDTMLVAGRKRLLAMRYCFLNGLRDGMIKVIYAEVDFNLSPYLSMIENAQRSPNELSDYRDIQTIRQTNPMVTYEVIAKAIGKPKTYVIQIDKRYNQIPTWAMTAALDGKIALTTAVELTKVGQDLQDEAHRQFLEKDKFSATAVKELKRLRSMQHSIGLAQSTPQMFPPATTGRDYIPADEIVAVIEMIDRHCKMAEVRAKLEEIINL